MVLVPTSGINFSFLFGNCSVTKVGNYDRSDRIGRRYLFEAIDQYEASRRPMAAAKVGVYAVSSIVLIEGD
jgi:hypothetical protein